MIESDFIKLLGIHSGNIKRVIGVEDALLDEKIFIFTGKGPRSTDYHLGNYLCHRIIYHVSKKLNCPVLFQISNDEKRFESNITLETARNLAIHVKERLEYLHWGSNLILFENLDPLNYLPLKMYSDMISYHIKIDKISKMFGSTNWFNGGYAMMQLAPLVYFGGTKFADHRPVVITGGDQVGYFLLFRDLCNKLNIKAPIIVELNPLKDTLLVEKMSSSHNKTAINFTIDGISKIMQSISDPTGHNDFGCHLVDLFLPYLEPTIQKRLTDARSDYTITGNSKSFKSVVRECLSTLLIDSVKIPMYTLFSKDIDMFHQLIDLEKHYVKSGNQTIIN